MAKTKYEEQIDAVIEKQIDALFSKYELGRDVFKKADWRMPLRLKEGATGTTNCLALMVDACGIIAKERYKLETNRNVIEVVGSARMIELYANIGLPRNYTHWSYGKQIEIMERNFDVGAMNLAFEIVINSNPTIASCMNTNSNMMMLLVIAHASFGHNTFFKNNVLFKENTNADEILGDLERMADYVAECEQKYGIDRVEKLLDACHALGAHAVDYSPRVPKYKSPVELAAHYAALELARERSYNPRAEDTKIKDWQKDSFSALLTARDPNVPLGEQNLLRVIGEMAPHLESWERRIIGMICDRAQYFYPQQQTKMGNEGCASFVHWKTMHDLHDLGLINDGMMIDFFQSHTGATQQLDESGPQVRINPYALGFAMSEDIERICKDPTDEDKKWFPSFAGSYIGYPERPGSQDYMDVIKDFWFNYNDVGRIYQYLSPKVMHDFRMFTVLADDKKGAVVTAVADDLGFEEIRRTMAESYDLTRSVPSISFLDYDERGDRTLTLKHQSINRKTLADDDAVETLKHIKYLWKHPVVLVDFDEDEKPIRTLAVPTMQKSRVLSPRP
ncbi:MAG: SpoVR family protein [Alphaproteobacteria bacterium]